jgi:hypothetical protein
MSCLKIVVLVVVEIITLLVVSFFWGGLQASINSMPGDKTGSGVVIAEIGISFLLCNIPIMTIFIITVIRSMREQAGVKKLKREERQKLDEIDRLLK